MRSIIIFLISCLFILKANSQQLDSIQNFTPKQSHDFYIKKQKTNLIAGWILMGTGVTLTISGLAINVGSGWGEGHKNDGLWLSYVGIGELLISIPVFISAGSNKRKARLALKNEHGFLIPKS